MRLSQYIEREPQVRRKKIKPAKASIATHGAFVPMLGLWGAALLGLTVLVLPDTIVERFAALTNGALAGFSARLVFSSIAAVLGGGLAFVIAGALRSAALTQSDNPPIVSALNARNTRPIDPVNELGSPSLDAPLEKEPFSADETEAEFEPVAEASAEKRGPTLGELSQRGYEMKAPEDTLPATKDTKDEIAFTHKEFQRALIESCEGASCEASAAPGDEAEIVLPIVRKPEKEPAAQPAPRELDLAEFAQLPGRNAVWVEGDAGAPQAETAARQAAKGPVPASALEKLRQKSTEELSLVEMVERFAGALHEHQQSERSRSVGSSAGRDAALVEALKALTLFTEQGFDEAAAVASPSEQLGKTERELRNALTKLQTLRGAA